MSHLLGRILLIVFLCGTMIACEKEELNSETPIDHIEMQYISFELEVANVVNEHRKELGLPTLKLLNIISKEAESHSIYMLEQESLNHDNLDIRVSNLINKANALSVGENVAFGYSTPQAALNAWIASAGHKANLEGDYSHYGVSIRIDNDGRKYYTNMFIKK